MKKEPYSYALISACCGLLLCFLADCLVCLGTMIGWLDDIEFYFEYILVDQIRLFVCQSLLNLLLIVMGILIVRFYKGNAKTKGRMVFIAMPLILESLAVITIYLLTKLEIFCIGIAVCVIAVALAGFYIRVYKIRDYILCCFIAIIFSVPCTLFIVRGMYYGFCTVQDIQAVTFVLQPFTVLFPIISLIKGKIFTSNIDDTKEHSDISSLPKHANSIKHAALSHCPQCGAELESGMLFCKECGTKIP